MSATAPKLRFPGFAEGWPIEPLGPRTTKVGSGVTPKGGAASYLSEGIPLIRSQNVRDGRLELDDVAYIAEATHARMSGTHVMPDDILLNITGASIGRSCIVPDHVGPANVNQHVCIIRLDAKDSPAFTQQYLASPRGQKQIDDLQGGSGREGLNFENIRSFRIPFPLLAEQQKIADFLGTVDAKLDALRQKKSGLEAFKSGLLQKIFSQEIRFTREDGSAFPEWEDRCVGDVLIASQVPGSNGEKARKLSVQLWGRGVRESDRIGSPSTKYYIRSAGQIIYSKLDFLNGAFGLIPPELDGLETTVDLPSFDVSAEADAHFLLSYISRREFYERHGSTADGTRKARRIQEDVFLSFPLQLPCIDEQRMIADALSAVDAKIAAVANQITHMETFKKGLLQQMFV